MNVIKNILLGIAHGFWDSICGMTWVLQIDNEMHKQNYELEKMRTLRLMDYDRRDRVRRTPSPVPSSAAAMQREEQEQLRVQKRVNPDERHLNSLSTKKKPVEEKPTAGEKKIAKKVFKCCLLNGVFTWASIVIFDHVLLPTLKFILTLFFGEQSEMLPLVWGWVHPILSLIFGMMWVLPIFIISKVVSSLWFADIANAAYRVRKGRPKLISNISKLIADFLFSIVVQMFFLVQSMLVALVPIKYVGESLCFVHICMLYSLYSFEYKWFNMGWELHQRLSYVETNWPYFFGFGIPLTVLTNLTSSVIVSGCIFSIFFPLFILSGNEAKPVVGTCNMSLKLFAPVVFIANICFGGNPFRKNNITAAQLQQLELEHQKLRQKQKEENDRLRLELEEYERERDRLSHSSSRSTTPTHAINRGQTGQFRYAQPPVFNKHKARSNTSNSSSSSSITTQEQMAALLNAKATHKAKLVLPTMSVPGATQNLASPIQSTMKSTPPITQQKNAPLIDAADDNYFGW